MGLHSMTGYGRGTAAAGGVRVEVELTSVNRKQLEVRLNVARALVALESRMVELIQQSISRGQVGGSVVVHVSETLKERSLHVDKHMAAAYIRELRATAKGLGLEDDLSASLLMKLPEVVTYCGVEENADAVWPVLAKALQGAVRALIAMRAREGQALADDLRKRFGRLDAMLARVRRAAPSVARRYRTSLHQRLCKSGVPLDVNDPQLLKELALFADKSDITEESTRLQSHLKQGDTLLKSTQPAGRTLDFLAQEMFREINTIGSKANDVVITRQVILFKTELERIREQVQNVE